MEYEKDKISRLINYKDNLSNLLLKSDLEWILEQYNNYYINSKEYEEKEYQNKNLLIKNYDLQDDKIKLKEELDLVKRKYRTLKENYHKLKREYNDCCKKLKSMI